MTSAQAAAASSAIRAGDLRCAPLRKSIRGIYPARTAARLIVSRQPIGRGAISATPAPTNLNGDFEMSNSSLSILRRTRERRDTMQTDIDRAVALSRARQEVIDAAIAWNASRSIDERTQAESTMRAAIFRLSFAQRRVDAAGQVRP